MFSRIYDLPEEYVKAYQQDLRRSRLAAFAPAFPEIVDSYAEVHPSRLAVRLGDWLISVGIWLKGERACPELSRSQA